MRVAIITSARAERGRPAPPAGRPRSSLTGAHLEACIREVATNRSNIDVARFDFENSKDYVARFSVEQVSLVVAACPDVLMLSCACWDTVAMMDLALRVREQRPACMVVAGGPQFVVCEDEDFARYPALDAVVVGEAEPAMMGLLDPRGVPREAVPNLVWRRPDGSIGRNPTQVYEGFPARPSPYLMGLLPSGMDMAYLDVVRGCRNRCKYCGPNARGYRAVSWATLEEEVRWLVGAGPGGVYLICSAVNLSQAVLEGISRAVAAGDTERQLRFFYFIDMNRFAPSQMDALRRIPTDPGFGLNLSIESLNASALAGVNRNPVQVPLLTSGLQALAREYSATVNLILGLPGDSLEGFRRTLDELEQVRNALPPGAIRRVTVNWLKVIKGTQLWVEAERHGLRFADEGIPFALGSDRFPRHDMRAALALLDEHALADVLELADSLPPELVQALER